MTTPLSERMLEEAYVGGIAGWDDMIDEVASLEKRLEAADLTIGTLQADRIKAQATIDHYRTMQEEAEEALRKYGDHMTYCRGNMDAPCTCGYHDVCKPAVKRMEGRQAWSGM